MNTDQKTAEWEGDIVRDTITYRYTELAISTLELAVEENPDLMEKYEDWLNKVPSSNDNENANASSAIFSEFKPEENTKIIIYSLPQKNQFLTIFETPAFNMALSFSYDFERSDLVAVRVSSFKGDFNVAASWAETVLARVDEAFEKLEDKD